MGEKATVPARGRETSREAARARPGRSAEELAWIAEAAYFRAEKRGFAPGNELDDWLEAEHYFKTEH